MTEKQIEQRVQSLAKRQGLVARKSRTRNPEAFTYGRFWLVDLMTDCVVFGGSNGMDVEEALNTVFQS